MTLLQRIAREPNAIAGVVASAYGLLVAFEVLAFTAPQLGAIVALYGAVVIALRWFVTPAGEVVAQRRPGGAVVTGQGASVNPGIPVEVTTLGLGDVPATERGAATAMVVVCALLLLLGAAAVVGNLIHLAWSEGGPVLATIVGGLCLLIVSALLTDRHAAH